jgi:TolA-binding protein
VTVRRRTVVLALLVFVGAVVVTTALGTLINAASEGQHAADRARDQAQSQASIVADQRAAQSRRIDQLTEQVAGLQEQARDQAALIGRQEQAIRDLATQVSSGGQDPVATAVAPRRQGTRTPAPTSGTKPTTKPTTAPKQQSAVRPAPATTATDDGLICSLLVIVC